MAELPDLDTSNVGFIAYWNAIDQGGVSSIDASEATSQGNLASTTLYDNGFDGVYNGSNGRQYNVRVKDDGWILAWMTPGSTFSRNEQTTGYWGNVVIDSTIHGQYDLFADWTVKSGSRDVVQNSLERAVNNLRAELSNSGAMAYSSSDVGLYTYEHTGTTVTGMVYEMSTDTETDFTHQYTSNADPSYYAIGGISSSDSSTYGAYTEFEGLTLGAPENANNEIEYGWLDGLGSGITTSPGTAYTHTSISGGNGQKQVGLVLTVWE